MSQDYTGHVEPDGDWQDRRDGHLFVRKLSVEEMDNNVYVLACAGTEEALRNIAETTLANASAFATGARSGNELTHDEVVGDTASR